MAEPQGPAVTNQNPPASGSAAPAAGDLGLPPEVVAAQAPVSGSAAPAVAPATAPPAEAAAPDPAPPVKKKKPKSGISTLLKRMSVALMLGSREEKKMAALFYVGILGALWILGTGLVQYIRHRAEIRAAEQALQQTKMSVMLKKQQEEARRANSNLRLGHFTIDLKPVPGKSQKGVQNLAEVELMVETNGKEARDYLDSHSVQLRDEISTVMVAMERAELMSREGKDVLKHRIIDALNHFLPKGLSVENVYIESLVVN